MLAALAARTKHIDAALGEQFSVRGRDRNPGIGTVFSHRRPLDGTKFAMIFDNIRSIALRRYRLETVSSTYLLP